MPRRSPFLLLTILVVGVVWGQPFPSFLLDTVPHYGPDVAWSHNKAAAWGDSVGLVVWSTGGRVLGCRVGRDGVPLDSLCLDIGGPTSRPPIWNDRLGVAFSGSSFFVCWPDHVPTHHGSPKLSGALVDTSGDVTNRFTLATPERGLSWVSVAFDGTNYLVTWMQWDESNNHRAWFSRVRPDGVLVDTLPRRVHPGQTLSCCDLDVAFGGGVYLVVCIQGDTAYAPWCNIVLPDGTVPDSVGFPIGGLVNAEEPAVTFNGYNFVVAAQENARELWVARVSPAGHVVDSSPLRIADNVCWYHDIGSACDTTMVVWSGRTGDSAFVYALRLDTSLAVIDSSPIAVSSSTHHPGEPWDYYADYPAVAGDDRGYLVAWSHALVGISHTTSTDAVCRRVSVSGVVLDSTEALLSRAANHQEECDVASDGQDFLAVWTDEGADPDSPERVRAARFTRLGEVLDPGGFNVGEPRSFDPAVAFGSGYYLVVWCNEGGRIRATRVGRDGNLPDTMPIRLPDSPDGGRTPDVAYGDGLFLVVWFRYPPGDIFGARVKPDGTVLDSVPLYLKIEDIDEQDPHVASDGQNFLVVRKHIGNDEIAAVRVSSAGEILDTAEIELERSAGSSGRVAFGDGVYLVAAEAGGKVWLVGTDGTVLHALRLPYELGRNTRVVFDGTNFLLASRSYEPEMAARKSRDYLGARISPDGRLLDPAPIQLLAWPDYRLIETSGIAADSSGCLAVATTTREWDHYMSGRARAAVFQDIVGLASQGATASARLAPTLVRHTLALGGVQPALLFDIAGRRVLSLQPGPNDIRRLAPGVYFVHEPTADGRQLTAVRKVVVQK
ncbi:MAG: hypothetical protein JSU73_12900 [candidate division WOR-3 bacterium]|nr:MAG: hypothetical protein JSU73_12900 [candidate division WOR-3 bacterium]